MDGTDRSGRAKLALLVFGLLIGLELGPAASLELPRMSVDISLDAGPMQAALRLAL